MRVRHMLLVLGLVGAAGLVATGQAPPPGGPGGGPPDFAAMRQMMMDRMKEALGASDDEWKSLQPKIEKIQELQRSSRGGGMGFMFGRGPGGPGGPGGGPGGPPDGQRSPVQEKVMDLRTTLDNKDAKADEIKAKLQAVREARAAAKAELTKAQEDLRGLLTTRQEAVLVMMGTLE